MHRNRIKMICFTIGLMMAVLLAGCSGKQDARTVELSEAKEGSVAEEKEEETEDSAIEENEDIYVHVCGEVNQPGELELKTRDDNTKNGIPVIEEVWETLNSLER